MCFSGSFSLRGESSPSFPYAIRTREQQKPTVPQQKEKQVWDSGFARYRDFLYQLFPGAQTDWFAIQRSNRPHVLTFNYDQAFEIAFLDRFNIQNYSLYDVRVLNSGLNLPGTEIEFDQESVFISKAPRFYWDVGRGHVRRICWALV
jgi:hypothetical protein